MTRFGYALTLASASMVAGALFVRAPSSQIPVRTPPAKQNHAVVTPPTKVVSPLTTTAGTTATSPTGVTPSSVKRSFVVDIVAFAKWGAGSDELGRSLDPEANSEAPMSLTVSDDDGSVWVLDQVNSRVVVFDAKGVVRKTVPIKIDHAQDLAIDPRGGLALLDRLVDRALVFVDDKGNERSRVALEGKGVDEAGGVTALFAEKDGFWVEYDHRSLVRVALPNGAPDAQRLTIDGRRIPGTSTILRAARDPSGFAVVSAIGSTSSASYLTRVPFALPVLQLEALEADPAGNAFVAAHLYEEGPAPKFAIVDEKIAVVALSPAGVDIGRFELPPPDGPEQQFRPIVMSKSGALYHLHVGTTGVTIRRAR